MQRQTDKCQGISLSHKLSIQGVALCKLSVKGGDGENMLAKMKMVTIFFTALCMVHRNRMSALLCKRAPLMLKRTMSLHVGITAFFFPCLHNTLS